MIQFHRTTLDQKAAYEALLAREPERGCEYSFANLYLWGRQEMAFLHGCAAFFSHFNGKTLYPYPIGPGDKRAVIRELLMDAAQRGIPCRLTGMTSRDKEELEGWFPGIFAFRSDRGSYDYVYDIQALAELKGRKLQKKRSHCNKFQALHPAYRTEPLTPENLPRVRELVDDWFARRREGDPNRDYVLEERALNKALGCHEPLGMETLVLLDGEAVLGVTMGSFLSETTFDIHFEKAREDIDGAYNAVNREFARYLREKYPRLRFLNREDDLGLEGLRQAKLSYCPDHMIEKYWACLTEDIAYED